MIKEMKFELEVRWLAVALSFVIWIIILHHIPDDLSLTPLLSVWLVWVGGSCIGFGWIERRLAEMRRERRRK